MASDLTQSSTYNAGYRDGRYGRPGGYQPWALPAEQREDYRQGYCAGVVAAVFSDPITEDYQGLVAGRARDWQEYRNPGNWQEYRNPLTGAVTMAPVLSMPETAPVQPIQPGDAIYQRSAPIPAGASICWTTLHTLEVAQGQLVAVEVARETDKALLIRWAATGAIMGQVAWIPKKALTIDYHVAYQVRTAAIQDWFQGKVNWHLDQKPKRKGKYQSAVITGVPT